MPELPELEVVSNILNKYEIATLNKIKSKKINRYLNYNINLYENNFVNKIKRNGKTLLIISDYFTVKINLGLTGMLLIKNENNSFLNKNKRAELEFTDMKNNNISVLLIDSRAFGTVKFLTNKEKDLEIPEFSSKLGKKIFFDKITSSKQPIYNLLIDQNTAPGIGSYVAIESLFRVGFHPMKTNLTTAEGETIYQKVRAVCSESIRKSGNTWGNFRYPDNSVGYYYEFMQMYGRNNKKCIVCKNNIKSIKMQGRSIPFCSYCQFL